MNSEGDIVERLYGQLSETALIDRVDRAVDETLATFSFEINTPIDASQVIRVWAALFLAIRRQWMGGRAPVDSLTAEDAVLALVEETYTGPHGSGYAAAMEDSQHEPPHGIAQVLVQLAEVMKRRQRIQYANAVLNAMGDPTNHRLRARVARTALNWFDALSDMPSPTFSNGDAARSWRAIVRYSIRVRDEQRRCHPKATNETDE